MLHNTKFLVLGLAAVVLAGQSARADFITIAQPTASYVSSTTVLDFSDPDFTTISSLSGGGMTLSYDTPLDERTVPDSWGSWNSPPAVESSTPRVATTDGVSTLTISLSRAATTFGLEVEPDNFAAELTTVSFYDGSTLVGTISQSPNGQSGALLFAASTTTSPFTSVVVNNTTGDDFAIARQRFATAAAAVPEPATYALTGSALLFAFLLRRKAFRKQ